MASKSSSAVLDAVARRLESEPQAVLPTLRVLADPRALDQPARASVASVARRVNAGQLTARRAEFRAGAIETGTVRQILGGVSRQAVAQRVSRRQLLAAEIAGRLYFPQWQFTDDGPHPRLAEVLGALLAGGRSPLAADALMRNSLPEENGQSAADLVAAGRVDLALHYITALGAGS